VATTRPALEDLHTAPPVASDPNGASADLRLMLTLAQSVILERGRINDVLREVILRQQRYVEQLEARLLALAVASGAQQ